MRDSLVVWAGGPLNRTGECNEAIYAYTNPEIDNDHEAGIDLHDRGITSISPGAFDDCGAPL